MIITTLIALFILSFVAFQATLLVSIINDHKAEKIFQDTVKQSYNLNISKKSILSLAFHRKSSGL